MRWPVRLVGRSRAFSLLRGSSIALGSIAIGALIVVFLPPLGPNPAWAAPLPSSLRDVRAAHDAFARVDIEAAESLLKAVPPGDRSDADYLSAEAQLYFHRGRYAEAAAAMDRSLAAKPLRGPNDPRGAFAPLLRSTQNATAKFVRQSSPNGRFQILHEPGKDALIVPYALEALERTDAALYEELGYRHPGPIRLEIYPHTRMLARVSTLTEEAIERTGTIALCKWDRLMVTSPRALLRGYPWIDTIAHEYVHLVLTRMTGDLAPVWVQEGLAKLLERRWRSASDRAPLEPAVEHLLADALRKSKLIPFDKLHPSIALLPSQEDAALAFGQVATFFETFRKRHGRAGIRAVIEALRTGQDARAALSTVAKARFDAIEDEWKSALRARAQSTKEAPRWRGKSLGQGGDAELAAVQANARRYVRLGDLLWARRSYRAATAEYAKARKLDGDDPTVASRLGQAALASGDANTVVTTLRDLVKRYPQHAPSRALLADGLLAQGDVSGAKENAIEAIRLNPFDPRPHCVLSRIEKTGPVSDRERDACLRLGAPGEGADHPR